jgi:hypothetical protein
MGEKLIPGIEYGIESAMFHKMLILKQESTSLKSSIPSQGLDVSKNQFNNRNDFSQGIDSWGPY